MLELIYISKATQTISNADIVNILAKSRKNNLQHGITGFLIFFENKFIQVLEGPQQSVEDTFARISKDPLHANIITIRKKSIQTQTYLDWSMAFEHLTNLHQENVDLYEDFVKNTASFEGIDDKKFEIISLLNQCRDKLVRLK